MEQVRTQPDSRSAKISSYSETADRHSSSEEYAQRFAGEIGEWMLSVQELGVFSLLPQNARTVLDIGGGHGQLARPLANRRRKVTVLGSSDICSYRIRDLVDEGKVRFALGDLIAPPFSDKSFDCVLSVRIMSHCASWQTLVSQMCRVTRHAVIFDYPTWCSTNILSPLLFSLKRKMEGNTRTYTTFTLKALEAEFCKHGFIRVTVKKQFFFPMGLHRLVGSAKWSRLLEGYAAALGLTKMFGSPVLVKFVRARGGHES